MARSVVIIFTTTLLTLLASAQDSPVADSKASTMTVTDQDNGKTIDLAKGDTLMVELSSNPSTGYGWKVKGDPSPLKLASSDYKQPDQSGKVGAPGVQQFRFDASAAGTSKLELVYRRPWEKGVAPARAFTVDVNVR